ncbi:hypothetical protein [Pelagibacterium halotolerans]|uniref:hypothetical protein n=1 Tax=Pelagibacterium halotolerans TaxID=531813 RepID=UPI00384F1CDB
MLQGLRDIPEDGRCLRRTCQGADACIRLLEDIFDPRGHEIDRFDRVQLAEVVRTCGRSASVSDAGRKLSSVSRAKLASTNDSDLFRKLPQRFGISHPPQ